MKFPESIQKLIKDIKRRAQCAIYGHHYLIDHFDNDGFLNAVECIHCSHKVFNVR